jgi:hypothetical protein
MNAGWYTALLGEADECGGCGHSFESHIRIEDGLSPMDPDPPFYLHHYECAELGCECLLNQGVGGHAVCT